MLIGVSLFMALVSGLNDAAITEIMYNPDGPTLGPDSLYEWVELCNLTAEPLQLQGMVFSDRGNGLVLDEYELAPGARVVVPADMESFVDAYGERVLVVSWTGEWPGLSNASDMITLSDRYGMMIDMLSYTDHWGIGEGQQRSAADGTGASLEKINIRGPNNAANWAASVDFDCPLPDPETGDDKCWGTPGAVNSVE